MELASCRSQAISGCGLGREAGLLSVCQTVRNHAEQNGGDENCRNECKHTSDIHTVSLSRIKSMSHAI
jgi:hypothetical protein